MRFLAAERTAPAKKLGWFLCVANYGSASVSAFTVNASTGALQQFWAPLPNRRWAFSLTLDAPQNFLRHIPTLINTA
jgi:hypothetical protein